MAVVAAEASAGATTREQEHEGSMAVAAPVAAPVAAATAPGSTIVKRKRKPPLTPWKKPKDMPRRPLSAYNLFFKEQRESLMRECLAAGAAERSSTTTTTTNTARSGKPRRSNKSVGIGFANLARTIAVHWNELNDETRAPYEAVAAREKNRYNAEMLVWRAKHQQQQLLQHQRVRRKDARSAKPATTEDSLDSLVDNSNDLKTTMRTESIASSMDIIDMDESVDELVALAADTGARNRQRNTEHLMDHFAGAPASSTAAACTANASSTVVSSTRHSVPSDPMGRDVLPHHQQQQGVMQESGQALHASLPPMDDLRAKVSQQQQQHSTTNHRRTVRAHSTSPIPLYATTPNASATTTTTTTTTTSENPQYSSASVLEQHERNDFLRQELFLRQHQALLQQHQQQCHQQILRNNELIAQLQQQQQQKPELLGYGGGVSEHSHHGLANTMADVVNLFGSHHSFLMGQSMPLNYYQQQQQQQNLADMVRRETWSVKNTWKSPMTSALPGMPLINNESHGPSSSSASTLYGKRLPDSCLEPQDFRSTLSQRNTVPRATETPGVSCGGSNNTDNDITKTFFPSDWFHLQDEDEDIRIPNARLPNTHKSSSASVTTTTTNLLMSRRGEIFGKLSANSTREPIHHTHEKVGVMKNKGSSIPTLPFTRVAKARSSAPTGVATSPTTLPPQPDSFLASSLVEPSAFGTLKPEFDQDTMDFLERLRDGTTGSSTATNTY